MPRDFRLYLDDIIEAAERIRRYAPKPDALDDEKPLDAVIRNLEVIGRRSELFPRKSGFSIPRSTGEGSLACVTS
jgi:uncharacterized protein with HEPN domain